MAVLRASGRPIYPINPMPVTRYRERSSMLGKKSDHGCHHAGQARPTTFNHLTTRTPTSVSCEVSTSHFDQGGRRK
jgi:hypothetical protein